MTEPSRTLSAANSVVVPPAFQAVTDVIVGHRPGPPLFHRQAGLGAVKRLDLRLLVNRQHQTVCGRVEIEPDHVAQLGGKRRVLRQLEVAHPMRLQPVRRPDPLHRAQRDAARRRHRPAGPVRRLPRRLRQCQFDHAIDQRRRQWRQPRFSRLVVEQASHAFAHEPLLPAPHTGLRNPGTAHDLGGAAALCRGQNDPRPPNMLLPAVAIRHHRHQLLAVGGPHLDLDPLAHRALSHASPQCGIL